LSSKINEFLGSGYTRRRYKVEAGAWRGGCLSSAILAAFASPSAASNEAKAGTAYRMHRNFGDFYLDYDYFNHHEILH
jgi:hypothetical protein